MLKREEQNVRQLKKIIIEVGELETESRMTRASESGLQKILDTKRMKNAQYWSPKDVERLRENSSEGQRMQNRWLQGLESLRQKDK